APEIFMPALGLAVMADVAGEVTDLLQHLIRNECVNDGTPESGREVRSVDVLNSYLEGSGADLERYSTGPGRENLVARLEGSDPSAPRGSRGPVRWSTAREPRGADG